MSSFYAIKRMLRDEVPNRLAMGTVVGTDFRGTRNVSVRLSGGRVCTRTLTCTDELSPGDEVIVARMEGRDRLIVLAKVQSQYASSTTGTSAILAPPSNLTATGAPGLIIVEWDDYPGEILCWQVQYNTAAQEDGATDAIVTRGSYYIHEIVDSSSDLGDETTRYFRVRAVRWLGSNNVMYSAWSAWTTGTSVTFDGRYYREGELSSYDCDEGASLIWICDADDNFPSTVSDVEGALDYIWDNAGAAAGAHNLLSATHTDTVTAAAARGYVVRGNATPKWERYDASTDGAALVGDGADVASTLTPTWKGLHTFNAGLVAGTGQDIDPTDGTGQDLGDSTHRWTAWLDEAHFEGANGANGISVPDNVADALHILDMGAGEYLRLVTTDAQPAVVFNESGADVDFTVNASGASPAFFVRGSDGFVTVARYFGHADDADTYLDFTPDSLQITIGGEGFLDLSAAEPVLIGNFTGGNIDFRWDGSYPVVSVLHVDADAAKVGVLTSTPTYELDVVGDIGLNRYLCHNDDADTYLDFEADSLKIDVGGAHFLHFSEGATDVLVGNYENEDIDFRWDGASDNIFYIDAANERVGIGTALPAYNLDITGLGYAVAAMKSYSTNAGILPSMFFMKSHSATEAVVETINGENFGSFRFYGVNTTPGWAMGAMFYGIQVGAAGAFCETDLVLVTYSTTGENSLQLVLDGGTGNVRMANYGAGDAQFLADGTLSSVSDKRLKTQIRGIEGGLAEVLQMQGKRWHFTKESGLETEHEYQGFIADDIEKIVPGAVGEDRHGMKTMSYSSLMPVFTQAFREVDARLRKLEGQK